MKGVSGSLKLEPSQDSEQKLHPEKTAKKPVAITARVFLVEAVTMAGFISKLRLGMQLHLNSDTCCQACLSLHVCEACL